MVFEILQSEMELDIEITQSVAEDYITNDTEDENDETVPAEGTTPVQTEPGGEVFPVPGTGSLS